MQIDIKLIQQLREITGAGVLDCKQALQEAQGDTQKACEILRKMGYEKAQEYINKETKVGRIASENVRSKSLLLDFYNAS